MSGHVSIQLDRATTKVIQTNGRMGGTHCGIVLTLHSSTIDLVTFHHVNVKLKLDFDNS